MTQLPNISDSAVSLSEYHVGVDQLCSQLVLKEGPLKRYLDGQTPLPMTCTATTLVYADCFQQDVAAALPYLPPGHKLGWEAIFIHSAAMTSAVHQAFGPGVGDPQDWIGILRLLARQTSVGSKPLASIDDDDTESYDQDEQNDQLQPGDHGCLLDSELQQFIIQAVDIVPSEIRVAMDSQRRSQVSYASFLLFQITASVGHIEVVRELLPVARKAPTRGFCLFTIALKHRQTQVIRLLFDSAPTLVRLTDPVKAGNLELAKLIDARFPEQLDGFAFSIFEPLRDGHPEIVWWLLSRAPDHQHPVFADIQNLCAAFGHLELLQHCIDHAIGNPLSSRAMDIAAKYGRLDSVIWLHENGHSCTEAAMIGASSNGHLSVVEFLHTHRSEGATPSAINDASRHGHISVIKYLASNRKEGCTVLAFKWSAYAGHFEIFRYLWDKFPEHRPISEKICGPRHLDNFWFIEFWLKHSESRQSDIDFFLSNALSGGHLYLADWLVEHYNARPHPKMMVSVAQSGNVVAAEWLFNHTESKSFNAASIRTAARLGHLHILKFLLYFTRLKITRDVCMNATLPVLQYLFAMEPEGVDWMEMSKNHSRKECRVWIMEQLQELGIMVPDSKSSSLNTDHEVESSSLEK